MILDYSVTIMKRFYKMGDPLLLEPKVGQDFRKNAAFTEVLELFDRLKYPQALKLIDQQLPLLADADRVDWLRLKVEFLATHDQVWPALATLNQILDYRPNDIQAHFLAAFYAHRNQIPKDFFYYAEKLQRISPAWHEKLLSVLEFINTHIGRNNLELDIKKTDRFDGLVLCGNMVLENGQPSKILLERLKKFLEMALKHPLAKLIVSGGAVNSSINEGWTMQQWLVMRGISAERIIVDPYARDTVGNIFAFEKAITEHDLHQICLVTSLSHLPRAWMGLKLNLEEQRYPASIKAAAPEAPGSIECPAGELALTYTTVIRSAHLFLPSDFS